MEIMQPIQMSVADIEDRNAAFGKTNRRYNPFRDILNDCYQLMEHDLTPVVICHPLTGSVLTTTSKEMVGRKFH